jgi:hypothetical protein
LWACQSGLTGKAVRRLVGSETENSLVVVVVGDYEMVIVGYFEMLSVDVT